MSSTSTLLLGVTATPERADNYGLDSVFEEITYEKPMLALIGEGYLCDISAIQVAIQGANLANLSVRQGDIVASEAGQALLAAKAPEQVAAAFVAHARARKAIIFAPTVDIAYAIATALREIGVNANGLDGETPQELRRQILADLHTGATQVVVNCGVLVEGFDEPSVDCIVIVRPTKSRTLYVQMIGRGTRLYLGKRDCLVIDMVGATNRHDLMTTPELFGLPAANLKTQTVAQAVASRGEPIIEATIDGALVSSVVNIFRQRPANWVPTRTGRFVLPIGRSTLVLRPQFGDAWDVLDVPNGGQPRLLATGLSLEFAQGVAEDHARDSGAMNLVDRNAWWRSQPPSEKQKYALKRLGIPVKSITTKGTASDAITAALAAEVA